jgi:type IV secretory pathway VirB10-like protein
MSDKVKKATPPPKKTAVTSPLPKKEATKATTPAPLADPVPTPVKEKKAKKEPKAKTETVESTDQGSTVDDTASTAVAKKGKGGKKPKTEKVTTPEKAEKDALKKKKRQFTVVSVLLENGEVGDFKGGKFYSLTPSGASRKSANQACKLLFGDKDCTVDITVQETTKSTDTKKYGNKSYTYRANRTLNQKAVEFKGASGGVNIPFKFSMSLKAIKQNKKGETVLETVDESVA